MPCRRTAPDTVLIETQVSIRSPCILWKLANIVGGSITPLPRAWAAMSMSCVPHGMRRRTRNCPKCVAAFAENDDTSSLAVNCSTV